MNKLGGKKKLICIDCGKEFEVDSMSRRKRCDKCYEMKKQESKRIEIKKYRDKIKCRGSSNN